ncbi:ComEC/Rec2 family competence protein [Tabrizicola sp. J26]|uniref:ComEC/Rec2 family competence protein n=1 Tax=Alitabrizicola rongguiensis TaxID=2909234 RepID=UPI001F18EF54|nr:ComEC/Rec2 family competence protein [Tabrizicola rongguiensis]MCF1710947.1 ComEC/Rec2 family competence protein [Tabrizicola rongguiensis]
MGRLGHPFTALAAARGTLFPFAPVLISCGIGLWFQLGWEPGPIFYAVLGVLTLAFGVAAFRAPELLQVPFWAAVCLCLGLLACGLRLTLVAAPVLEFRYYGPVQGRVVEIDRSDSDFPRVTLDRVVLSRVDPDRTPQTVRVTLRWTGPQTEPRPGLTVIVTANLSPPPGPAEPGGFDFRRMAYFEGLGAVGSSRSPLLALEPAAPGEEWVNRLRAHLSGAIMARIPGQAGAFASGAVTGDRSEIAQVTVEDLRASNLSHLLAISGMNMAFLTGFVFALVRYGIALVPPVALRVNSKKVAAVVALAVSAFYLALSGANVATERAFVMVAVMLVAVLADRRAFTLRAVALAATLLLLWQPDSLLAPGFQMSFAATIALVAGFDALRSWPRLLTLPRWGRVVMVAVLSTVIAGLATAPLGAGHFNRFTDYGMIANLLTVPVMGMLIMPGAVIAALLAPFGLAAPGLWAMEVGARWILAVAHLVAGWEGAVTGIPAPVPAVLPTMALGALWLVIWQGRARWIGIAPILAAILLWGIVPRADLLVSADGGLAGILGPQGRALSTATGAGFAAADWLENDGDLADQEEAARREGFTGPPARRRFRLGQWRGIVLKGKGALSTLGPACRENDLVILAADLADLPEGCTVIDRAELALSGAIAGWLEPDGALRLVPANRATRAWTGQAKAQPVIVLPPPQ